jgi:glycosyltransferase involved in cell wall biosynthesis
MASTGYTPISIVMIVKNEAKIIRPCLKAAAWADEIVVLDTGSTDSTPQVCAEMGAKVYQLDKWEGFGKARQKAVSYASNDWIFSVDADEIVSPELKADIQRHCRDGFDFDAYRVPSKIYYLGKRINFCRWKNEVHVSVFNRTKGNFNDALVHESVKGISHIGMMKGLLHHYSYPDRETHIAKMKLYGEMGAQKLKARGKTSTPAAAFVRGLLTFLKMYIARGGILDGRHGFLYCQTTAWGTWYKYKQLWKINKGKA